MMTQSLGPPSQCAVAGFRTKEDDDLKALRASAVIKVTNEIRSFEEALLHLQTVAREVAGGQDTGNKKMASISKAVTAACQRLADLEERVVVVEQNFAEFRRALLTEIKKEYINVPAPKNEHPRHMSIQPSDMGEVKKKRRNAAIAASMTAAGKRAIGYEHGPTRNKKKQKTLLKNAAKKKIKPIGKTIIKTEPLNQYGTNE